MGTFTLTFLLPCAIAALSGMGMGGGGLLVVYLRLLGAESQLAIQALNIIFFLFSSGASLIFHLPRRRIYGGAVLVMSVFGLLGSLLGSPLAIWLDGALLRRLFGGMLIAAGLYGAVKSFFRTKNTEKSLQKPQNPTHSA